MPSIDQHLDQVAHNEAFLASIDRNANSDWALTVLFYTGLHEIDALLASKNIHPGGHPVRDQAVAGNVELLPIAKYYFRLKSRSQNARYNCVRFSAAEVNRAERDDWGTIKRELSRYLNGS